MTERHFKLKIGKGTADFSIPEEQLLYELVGENLAPPEDLAAAYLNALAHPIDSPPLSEIVNPGETVAIAVSDITRVWQHNELTLPLLIDYLNQAGIADKDITIIIAVGAHRQNTAQELEELCTKAICRRVKVINHNAWDKDNMVYYGKTSRGTEASFNRVVAEADRVILTGGVIYHYMVGYGGGRKSIMPGVSSLKTIQQSHMWAMGKRTGDGSNPLAANMKTLGNPAHEDMMEVAAFVKPDFIVNVVPNLDGDITGIFTGNWISAWQKATQMVDEIFGVTIDEQADIVIASAGGYPKDINLYQSQKTIDNAVYAMKPGGIAIILADCPDIKEPGEFFDWFSYPSAFDMEKAVRENFLISGWVAVRQLEYANRGHIILVTQEKNIKLAENAGVQGVTSMEEALAIAYEKCDQNRPKITIMPQGANTFPILET
ncbi:MAG: nickel-dependent lactate racemase [Desulfobacula sp.]|jgi:lactate racemase|uniref:nickel-dependent lactate racemase n=1 Tax=Desulfobacula sp. TaxID=2593537 RepID=UPI001DAA5EB6|nr:nickel-dependent lactate racemase [Desulfobacula sp.]MBT3487086.1 nickel-dependent lactate racemase [Desulfobacula sp.]MBT3805793.1 nickel-dependent lactate racemase [Desulfobacula sp.]MBT4024767.1 nickel-dependent lactate racemase [Desulfobacula sp.]MBT4200207.1 nickel-dependent lactate racemase [Desulfobacula sp.]